MTALHTREADDLRALLDMAVKRTHRGPNPDLPAVQPITTTLTELSRLHIQNLKSYKKAILNKN
jgi:hypothetical protein